MCYALPASECYRGPVVNTQRDDYAQTRWSFRSRHVGCEPANHRDFGASLRQRTRLRTAVASRKKHEHRVGRRRVR